MDSKRQVFLQRKLDDLIEVFGSRRCKSDTVGDLQDREQDPRLTRSLPQSPGQSSIDVERPPRPLFQQIINNCYAESFKQIGRPMKKLNGEGVNKQFQKGGLFEKDLRRSDSRIVSVEEQNDEWQRPKDQKYRGRKNRYLNAIDEQDNESGAILDLDAEGTSSNFRMRADYLASIREEDEILKKTKIIQRKLKKQQSNSTQSSPLKNKRSTLESVSSQRRVSVDARVEQQAHRPKKTKSPNSLEQFAPSVKSDQPEANLRNFNEINILGTVERDFLGNVQVDQTDEGGFVDLVGRQVNAQGYLINTVGDIVSAHDPLKVIFPSASLVDGQLPAPFLFERFNFNAFEVFGNFKSYKLSNDVTSFTKNKTPQNTLTDDQQRQVNKQGLLVNSKGNIIDQSSRVVFDVKQLKDGYLHPLITWKGTPFQTTDVMGCFQMNDQNQIILIESKTTGYKDLGGHQVNERGYLINAVGHIVNRKGKVLFKSKELKNGEFPKIFKFSKFDHTAIKGTFTRGQDKKPMLTEVEGGQLLDDQGKLCNKTGYLVDELGNIVDRQSNIQFEGYLLSEDSGRLPTILKGQKLIRPDSEAELSDILQQIEDDLISKQDQTIEQLENSPQKQDGSRYRLANRTFNNQSPSQLDPDPNTNKSISDGRSSANPNTARKSRYEYKMVKKESMHESDKLMANAYGGEAVPRVRMVHKRFNTNVRERERSGRVLRDSSILSPTQMLVSQEFTQHKPPLIPQINLGNMRSRILLESANNRVEVNSAGRESNMAKSIHNFNHQKTFKKQEQFETDPDLNALEAQNEMNKYMDQFNSQLQSMGDLNEQISNATFTEMNQSSQQLLKRDD